MTEPLFTDLQAEHARKLAIRYDAWREAIHVEEKTLDDWGSVLVWSTLLKEQQDLTQINLVPDTRLEYWIKRSSDVRNAAMRRYTEKADPGGYGPTIYVVRNSTDLIPDSNLNYSDATSGA
jgi:hypothetical protein